MFEACGTYASFDVPDAARSTAASAKAAHAKDVEQIKRDIDKAVERDLANFRQRCARGEQEYCVQAVCLQLAVDDSDANLIACTRARGFRVGNGWVANDHGQPIPGIPRPDWSIGVTCMRKMGGNRPSATIWRKFGVPESAFDLQAEAAKACQAKYAEAQGKGRP
jgi:hypothetical protein